jgi:hypothetical protein
MKSFIPTVIISFALGFACNKYLFSNHVETVKQIDAITSPAVSSQTLQKAPHLLATTDELDSDSYAPEDNNQNQAAHNEVNVKDLIALALEKGVNQEKYDFLQESIASLTLEEQTTLHAEIISQLPNKKLHGLLSLVTKNIIENNPSLLVDLIRKSQPEGGIIVARQGLAILAVQSSLEDAWNLANSLGPGGEEKIFSNSELRSSRFGILMALSKDTSNLTELFDFVSTIKGRDKLSYLSMLVSSSAKEDVISTRQQIMALPAGESKNRAVSSLMRVWSDENANEAIDWLIDNPDLTDKYTMINTAERLLNQDGLQTFSDYYQNTDSNDVKQQLATAAAKHYVISDIEQSIDWLKKVDSPREQSMALYSTLMELGYEQNMDKHIQVLESVYSGDNSRQASTSYGRALTKWSEYQPEKVNAYVENLPAEQDELKQTLKRMLKL